MMSVFTAASKARGSILITRLHLTSAGYSSLTQASVPARLHSVHTLLSGPHLNGAPTSYNQERRKNNLPKEPA